MCYILESIKQRLPRNASIFTAEVTAIDLALDICILGGCLC